MGGANLMRHCRQCRADAVGLLGEDRSDEFTLDKIEQMEVVYDLDKRRAYQAEASRPSARRSTPPRLEALEAVAPSDAHGGHPRRRPAGAGRRGHRGPGQA